MQHESDNHSSGRTILTTILGEIVLSNGGWAWTSTLIEACDALDIGEPNVRQALSRLAESDLISARRVGRRAQWFLTPSGETRLSAGRERIYSFAGSTEAWPGSWLVLVVTIPEKQRQDRRRMRALLEFEGFGFPAPGVAVSPHVNREDALRRIIDEFGLTDALVFRATSSQLTDSSTVIERAWDLDPLEEKYRTFVDRFETLEPENGPCSFAALIRLVHEWRRFPSLDPEIPCDLTRWAGEEAHAVFKKQRAAWRPPAELWYQSIC